MSWIDAKKQKPGNKPVLIWSLIYYHGNSGVAYYEEGQWFLYHTSAGNEPISEPDYWMPLPAPPNMEGGEG